ncbi:hypothetical protein HF325_003723 [Metschnikowia pulcherrima]|uniref:F-actin-capping protein subunit beta n=1 Tax=Metschnikowia pulcherrima TaxID=27326 RepID=A0A8H7GRI0_9ASCO|nr:hypothetical protein HF325_003723 [Metschnikowia pulcherrima]
MADKFDASLDLLRRLDPKAVSSNLNSICSLLQLDGSDEGVELAQDLLAAVDTPLKVAKCPETNKLFLCCDYNRDGDLYRSPFSNKYAPETGDDDSPYPSPLLRQLEMKANESFDIYRDLYYEGGGYSLVYLWDTCEDVEANSIEEGFAGVVLFKKETEDHSGKWDSVHVFEVAPESATLACYKVTSAVILDLQKDGGKKTVFLIRKHDKALLSTEGGSLEWAHLVNLGQLVEKLETNVRNLLQDVYFDKLKDIFLKDLRSLGDVSEKRAEDNRQQEVIRGLQSL